MAFQDDLTKFKNDLRDGAQALSLAADGVAQSVVEATKTRDDLVVEIKDLGTKRDSIKTEIILLTEAQTKLQNIVADLRGIISNVKV